MRILYAHRTQATGAEGAHIRGVILGFRMLGHKVDVITPYGMSIDTNDPGTPPSDPSFDPSRKGLLRKVFARAAASLPEFIFEAVELAYNVYSFSATYLRLRRGRYDLYYERYALFNLGGVLAARLRSVPSVAEVNDSALIQRSRPLVFKLGARALEAKALGLADRVVTISGPFRDYLSAYGDAVVQKTEVIPNAVDPARFPADLDGPRMRATREAIRADYGIGCRRVLGVAGAFVAWHGITFLIESVGDLLRSEDLHLLLVGDGPVRPDVERLIAELRLEDRVTLTGFLSPADVVRLLAVFDIGLMPDSNSHGSPMKIFEYMAMGVPVVAARYRPIEEVIRHGETGFLFEPRDADALRATILSALRAPHLTAQVARRGRESVLANHTWRRVAERTLQLFGPATAATEATAATRPANDAAVTEP